MLKRCIFVVAFPGEPDGAVQGFFQVPGQHLAETLLASGSSLFPA